MMYSAEYQGVLFIEGAPNSAKVLSDISSEINTFFGQSQLKTLDDVKAQMVVAVKQAGGNAVIDFKYGQKSTFWKSIFGLDNVYWFASGKIAIVNLADFPPSKNQ